MAIKFHHFFQDDCSPYIDIQNFEADLKKEFRHVQNAAVYMIHRPFINNILDINIDLLLIIAIENKEKNYYRVEGKFYEDHIGNKKSIYLQNIIMPIKFIDEFRHSSVEIYDSPYQQRNDGICVNNEIEIDYETDISKLQYGIKQFFRNILNSVEIKPLPIIWILSDIREKYYFRSHNILQAYRFGFEELKAFLKFSCNNYFNANPSWAEDNKIESYQLLFEEMETIKQILENEAKISILTKKKIDSISLQHHKDNQIYEKYLSQKNYQPIANEIMNLGKTTKKIIKLPNRIQADKNLANNLILIQGKAGSGKTTELLLLMKKQLESKKHIRYITYNRLLSNFVYKFKELAKFSGSTHLSTKTIHGFMSDIGKTMGGVVFIMGEKRVENLINILDKHISFIQNKIIPQFSKLSDLLDVNNLKLSKILAEYQEQYRDEVAEFREFQLFIRQKKLTNHILDQYRNRQISRIQSLVGKEIFLNDYYGVLNNIYLCLTNPRKFYDEYKVSQLSENTIKRILKNKAGNYDIKDFDDFQKMINSSRAAYSIHIPVIDEGQDFHPLERDILFEIFHKKNMVVATGGKEQLIRHQLECDWTVDNQGKKHNIIMINKYNKSYRLNKGIASLCNELAKKFEIQLDLETDNQDLGNIIISSNPQDIQAAFNTFRENGEKNELNPCESIHLMIEAESKIFNHQCYEQEVVKISENGVAIKNIVKSKSRPNLSMYLDTTGLNFYYTNMGDDVLNKKIISNSEYLVSFYESCRGLESWSVMCLELDKFYERKKAEDTALNFLSDDLLLTDEERRQRYAMTWVLMALTRAMHGLFIYISDANSELGKLFFKSNEK